METILQEKEKTLEDVESKLNDDDYMDSVSEETASGLKNKRRIIRNEGMQLQSQYMQTLQQANMKIIQKLTEVIGKASAQVAQDTFRRRACDLIFTDEACTYLFLASMFQTGLLQKWTQSLMPNKKKALKTINSSYMKASQGFASSLPCAPCNLGGMQYR